MNIVDRFLKYVSFATTSDETTGTTPSTPGQMVFARYLADELKTIGMTDVTLDENGYIMASLPSNVQRDKVPSTKDIPVIGFIAHMDTSPDVSGENIKPQIVTATDGRYAGQQIIKTDGTTLLGADDKAGIAEIVTAMEYLIAHPEIKHGKVRVGFTPDEEIGCGADHFDVAAFGADFAYTMDGGAIGELEYENFNAAACKVHFHGINVHPGAAYHKMINSMLVAQRFAAMLPSDETPAETQGYEGFYHLVGMSGTVEESTLSYIIRDHDRTRFEERKREIERLAALINDEYGAGTAEVEMRDQYYNMREKIEPVMHIIDLAKQAMEAVGVTPCPNIFAGGENFHSRMEFVPIPSMEAARDVILEIVKMVAAQR